MKQTLKGGGLGITHLDLAGCVFVFLAEFRTFAAMNRIIKYWLTVAICVIATSMASAQISGPWHGELVVGMQSLPIVFNFDESGDGIAATVDSPLQGAKGIPAEATLNADTLDVSIPMLGVKYCGIVRGDRIEGRFSQSGMTFDLALEPGEYIPPRPQTPQPPYPYETREVEFVNPVDSTVLSGTFTLPTQYRMPVFREFPVVIFVTGSGAQNRDEEIMGHKPFAVLADCLAKSGIASLRYDDRGFGQSTGDRAQATTATYAGDAKAAIDYVRANFDKAGKVGVIGHSEGGSIAFMLAAGGDANFIVSLAGPAMRGDSVLLLQNEAILKNAITPAELSQYMEGLQIVFRHVIDDVNKVDADPVAVEESIAALDLPQGMKDNLKEILATRNPWMDFFLAYDPAENIGKISVPVMAINGELDCQVIAEPNLAALQRTLPAGTPCLAIAYPGLNHMLQHAQTGLPAEYGQIQETISEEVITDIIGWIKSL